MVVDEPPGERVGGMEDMRPVAVDDDAMFFVGGDVAPHGVARFNHQHFFIQRAEKIGDRSQDSPLPTIKSSYFIGFIILCLEEKASFLFQNRD
jgi:predicted DNA repair protein MutK